MYTEYDAAHANPMDLLVLNPTKDLCENVLNHFVVNEMTAAVCAGCLLNRRREAQQYLEGTSRNLVLSVFDSKLKQRKKLLNLMGRPCKAIQEVIPMYFRLFTSWELLNGAMPKFTTLLSLLGELGYIDVLLEDLLHILVQEESLLSNVSGMTAVYKALASCCPPIPKVTKPEVLAAPYHYIWDLCFENAKSDNSVFSYIQDIIALCKEIGIEPCGIIFKLLAEEGYSG